MYLEQSDLLTSKEAELYSEMSHITNSHSAKFNNYNFHPLEAVSRYRDPQVQVGENYSYWFILRPNICKSCCLNTLFVPNNFDLTLWLPGRGAYQDQDILV